MSDAKPDSVEAHDQRRRRCPRLGHEITFGYCRTTESNTPCAKILDCWFETFDVADWARKNLPADVLEGLTQPPKPKMLSLVEMIRQAQRRTGQGDAGEEG